MYPSQEQTQRAIISLLRKKPYETLPQIMNTIGLDFQKKGLAPNSEEISGQVHAPISDGVLVNMDENRPNVLAWQKRIRLSPSGRRAHSSPIDKMIDYILAHWIAIAALVLSVLALFQR